MRLRRIDVDGGRDPTDERVLSLSGGDAAAQCRSIRKSGGFSECPSDVRGGVASILPTTTATTLSATTSIPRTGDGSAAPAVLQKLGHPHPPPHVSPPRIWYGSRGYISLFYPPYIFSPYISIHPPICLSVHLSIYLIYLSSYISIQLSVYRYIYLAIACGYCWLSASKRLLNA